MTVAIKGVPEEYLQDPKLGEYKPKGLTSAGYNDIRVQRAKDQFLRGRLKYNVRNQPRDERGKFRQVLARLRFDLGKKQLQEIVQEIRYAEAADEVGDYQKSADAGQNVIGMIDKIDAGTLDATSVKNIRAGARELGKVMAYLPLPQGENAEKVRYSDLPPSTKKLIDDLITRVIEKIGASDASAANEVIRSFKSGVRTMSADELLAQLNKLTRLLT